ncbi:hypothetical protein LGAS_0932 [Lactobacillus gasseri ATCC 33323 = JCM 1131]|uniref:Uncharacterized protein n=1 Tax=Lactobacillus gasseri (strain ATCC 33323 / DSM 20243 / BCRC 14619 / CIP 102991 / JCM 1131 / KCTC 3163 / NCIMB 11718 / NCTC 13722 / AM63) TaxID=324831 RepID=A0A805ZHB5_LACGA|nr:hypothetical protein LGAS_0932 [Lactobacillus gasseri ATCC 33323 = JCM 1131]
MKRSTLTSETLLTPHQKTHRYNLALVLARSAHYFDSFFLAS